jgi:phytoene synthase
MTPAQYCQDKARQSHSSFYYAFRFASRDKREAMMALYAFCREIDDVVDDYKEENIARTKLNWWRGEIDQLYAGNPQHPATRALLPAIKQYHLQQALFLELIDGMEMDLDQNRYPDFTALQLYCYRVASVVGLLTVDILGYQNRNTLKYAHHLGIAFQLTNIIRDVGEDAARGRIYLPQDEMQQFGVKESDLLAGKTSPAFTQLMAFQIQRAQQYYETAGAFLPREDQKAQRISQYMNVIYRTLLNRISQAGPETVLRERLSLSTFYKLWLGCKTWLVR